jgi:glycogenin glucosyltransferase
MLHKADCLDPYLIDRWYAVYDRHVRPQASLGSDASRFAVPEHVAVWNRSGVPSRPDDRLDLDALKVAAQKGSSAFSESGQYLSLPLDGRVDLLMPKPTSKKVSFRDATPSSSTAPGPPATTAGSSSTPIAAPKPQWHNQQVDHSQAWDAVHYAPPAHGEPEMKIPMDTRYKPAWERPTAEQSAYHSQSRSQQSQYPTLPPSVRHNDWYKEYTQSAPNRENVRAVFPWEKQGRQQAERVFPRGDTPPPHQHSMPRVNIQAASPVQSPEQSQSRSAPQAAQPPRSMAEAMASYKNAWDSDPRIGKYVDRLTGGPKSRQQHSSSDFGNVDMGALQSMPGTPNKMQQPWPDHGNRSDASEDGDDEDDGDYEPDIGSSPPSLGRAAGQEMKAIPFSLPDGPGYYKSNAKYRDRQSQTDKPVSRDQKVQAVEGHVSPAVATQRLPSLSGRRPSNRSHPSSSSDTPKPVTPASSQPLSSNRSRPPIPFPVYNSQSSSSSRYPGQSPPQSHSPRLNDPSTTNVNHNLGTTRVFDPSTDVDMRKKDSHKVLSRFMQAGAFGQSGGAGGNGKMA